MTLAKSRQGRTNRRMGRLSEYGCALWLMAKGYRLLGFRLRTPQAEIDILVVKRGVVAAVEVKRRQTLEAALEAVSFAQRRRLTAAVRALGARRPDLAKVPVRLDLIALAPGRLPRHIRDAWRDLE